MSTSGQTVANQRQAIIADGCTVTKEYVDEAVSGTSSAAGPPAWELCLSYLRDGYTLVVYALDRIGRSTIDVLTRTNTLA